MTAGPGGSTRRPPQTAAAVERQARRLDRRASLPSFLAVLTAPLAAAFLWTLPLAPLQMWFAARAFLRLRQHRPTEAVLPLGIACGIGVALVLESLLALQPLVALGDLLNVAALAWAWVALDRARAKAREAWGIHAVDVLDRSAALAWRRSPPAQADRARVEAEDDLAYLDAAVPDDDARSGRDTGREGQ